MSESPSPTEAPGKVEPRAYSAVRGEFRTGDVLCFRGRDLASWLIRALTRSRYSHVGLVYKLEGRVFCIEATGIGVHLILMRELVRRYHGGIDYFRMIDVTAEQRAGAIGFAFDQMGKRYDRWGLVRFLWFLASGRKHRSRERSYWYCSEIVAEAYRAAGAPFIEGRVGYVSPADIAASPRVDFEFRVKRE